MVVQNLLSQPTPEFLNGIEPTGISRQEQRCQMQVCRRLQRGGMVMNSIPVVLDDKDGWLVIFLADTMIQVLHLPQAKLIALMVQNLARNAIHGGANAG